MAYKKFKSNDIFYNTLELHPECDFIIYDSKIYLNSRGAISGAFVTNAGDVPTGHVSLYEINVDRGSHISGAYPFITKDGTLSSFKTISSSSFHSDYNYGDKLTGSYPMSASIVREFFASTATSRTGSNNHITSLVNTLNYYQPMSNHYAFDGPLGDKGKFDINLISIPSIIYGSQIKKGTVDLRFYVSGTLIGQLKDANRDGELIQVGPTDSTESGSVAGVVLYNEGFVLLTGSWNMATGPSSDFAGEKYTGAGVLAPKWIYFGAGANDGISSANVVSSSFGLTFKGTTNAQTITMLAHAQKGELNHSNNPTFRASGSNSGLPSHNPTPTTSSIGYAEDSNLGIKNIVSSSYPDPTGSFKKITYISSIGIYDDKKNLIGIAKVATPVKKTEDREFTFKLKLDI
tara:strand:- start:1055 stop:2266 length:1212 start_codon:yes stop_codon:yes gene_type:complete